MKSRIIASLICLFFAANLFAQQVENTQKTLVTKRTASWCPNCGTWGWAFFHDLLQDNLDGAILMAAHYDGNLMTKAALEITDNFGGVYQPVFFLNHTNLDASPFNTATLRPQIKDQISNNNKTAPVANAGFTPVFDGAGIKVDARVKFFKAASGEYYLGIYLLEDNVISYQSGIGDNAKHMKLLRNSFTESSWGKLIVNGSTSANQEFNLSYLLPSGNPAGKAYEVAAIIWKKNGTKYEVINVWSTNIITTTTNTHSLEQIAEFKVFPTVANQSATIQLSLTAAMFDASIELIDINGRVIHQLYKGGLNAGETRFQLYRQDNMVGGTYFLQLKNGEARFMERVIFD